MITTRTLFLAAALAAAAPAPTTAEDVAAGIARLCGADASCRAGQAQAFAALRAAARADRARTPSAVKAIMFECFLATGHAARAVMADAAPPAPDWRAMLACYHDRMPPR